MWGTTLDSIVSMEVVLADGRIVTASETSQPDLFWVGVPLPPRFSRSAAR